MAMRTAVGKKLDKLPAQGETFELLQVKAESVLTIANHSLSKATEAEYSLYTNRSSSSWMRPAGRLSRLIST